MGTNELRAYFCSRLCSLMVGFISIGYLMITF